jgi:uncharacterized protein YciI
VFVVLLTYVAPIADVDRHMREHVAFLREAYASKTFIASGRRVPRTGGVILARADGREAIEALMAKDPFVREGVATFEVVEFRTSQYDDAFAPFADSTG